jgi:hypothetical protein
LYIRSSNGGGWTGWEPLDGVLTSEPVPVSSAAGRVDVFARGADLALYQRTRID